MTMNYYHLRRRAKPYTFEGIWESFVKGDIIPDLVGSNEFYHYGITRFDPDIVNFRLKARTEL